MLSYVCHVSDTTARALLAISSTTGFHLPQTHHKPAHQLQKYQQNTKNEVEKALWG